MILKYKVVTRFKIISLCNFFQRLSLSLIKLYNFVFSILYVKSDKP